MGCGCKNEDGFEQKGESIEFEGFESDKMEHISVEEAKEQEKVAEQVRG